MVDKIKILTSLMSLFQPIKFVVAKSYFMYCFDNCVDCQALIKKFAFSIKTYSSKELYNKLMRCFGSYVVLACNATLTVPYPFDMY